MPTYKRSRKIKNEMSISDRNLQVFKIIIFLAIILLISSLIKFKNYSSSLILKFDNLFKDKSISWTDSFYDAIFSLLAGIVFYLVYYDDFNTNIFEIMYFYNKGKLNKNIFIRWITYTIVLVITCILSVILKYRASIDSLESVGLLLFRFIVPLIYMCSLCLFIVVWFKNPILSLGVVVIYILVDILSTGRVFRMFTLLGDSMYFNNLSDFIINRITLIVVSLAMLFFSMKKSMEL